MEELAIGVQKESRDKAAAQVLWSSAQRMLDLDVLATEPRGEQQRRIDYCQQLDRFKEGQRSARASRNRAADGSGGPQA